MTITEEFKSYGCGGKGHALKPFIYKPRPLGPKDIEVDISHCGICGSDIHTLDSGWGPSSYPVVVGHEIVGKVTKVGSEVTQHKIGDRVGVGAQVLACNECEICKKGDDNLCQAKTFTYNSKYPDNECSRGGYADKVRVHEKWAFEIPASLPSDVAAPLLCAGVTVYAPLKRFNCSSGKAVGVAGIGGLGHLAIQFANKLGAKVVAVSSNPSKKEETKKLGAADFCNLSDDGDFMRLTGSLDIILITSFYAHQTLDKYLSLLKTGGTAILVGVPEHPISLSAFSIIGSQACIAGSLIGSTKEVKEMLAFAAKHDVKPWISVMPVEQCNEAIQLVRDGKPRYRIVLAKSEKSYQFTKSEV